MCNGKETKCWVLKKYRFNTLGTPIPRYGVELWSNKISKFTWKDFENVQKHFLMRFLQIKRQKSYMLLFHETKITCY